MGLTDTVNYVATLHRRSLREGTGAVVRPRPPGQDRAGLMGPGTAVAGGGGARRGDRPPLKVNQCTVLHHLGPTGVQGELQSPQEPSLSASPEPGPGERIAEW